MIVTLVAFIGIFFSAFLRAILPFLIKMRDLAEGESLDWNHAYTMTVLIAIVTGFIIAALSFPLFNIPVDAANLIAVFFVSFCYGWGQTDIFNKVMADWRKEAR